MSYQVNAVTQFVTEIKCDAIPGCWVNSYVIRSNKFNYIIDSGLGGETAKVMIECVDEAKDTFLINTHYHWDHIWGNYLFADAMAICHEKCEKNINEMWNEMIRNNGKYIDGATEKPIFNLTFSNKIRINNELDLIFTPGHTNDSVSVFYEPDEALFVGDIIGDNDLELIPSIKDPSNFVKSLNICIDYKPKIYLSGHNNIKKYGIIEKIKEMYLMKLQS